MGIISFFRDLNSPRHWHVERAPRALQLPDGNAIPKDAWVAQRRLPGGKMEYRAPTPAEAEEADWMLAISI